MDTNKKIPAGLQQIRDLCQKGKTEKAIEKSKELLLKYPDDIKVKYFYGVVHGDHAEHPSLSAQKKKEYLDIAKSVINELLNHPNFEEFDSQFQFFIKNEYFWFFKMPKEQFDLGVKGIADGIERASYSCCVGASMLAFNELKDGNKEAFKEWANKSLNYFAEFEKVDPTWSNINYFSAQAHACLGDFEKALAAFTDMFRKQESEIDQAQLDEFLSKIEQIKELL